MRLQINVFSLFLSLLSFQAMATFVFAESQDDSPQESLPDLEVDVYKIAQESLDRYSNDSEEADIATPGLSLPAKLYAALYFYEPYAKPLTSFPSIRRISKSTVDIALDGDVAVRAYGANGLSKNIATLVLGRNNITIQDLSLAARLAAKGGILNNRVGALDNLGDFTALAKEPVEFDAILHKERLTAGCSVSFFDKQLRITAGVPFVVGTNRLKVSNDGALFKKALARSGRVLAGDFKNHTLSEFVNSLLADMGMKTNEQSTLYGLGQSFIGVTYQPNNDFFDAVQVGLNLYVPSTAALDNNVIFPVELDPNNFAISMHSMMLFSCNRIFNPYVYVDGRFNFASKIKRRVARLVARGGAAQPAEKMALGRWFDFVLGASFNNEIESSVVGFSDFVSDIEWTQGHSVDIQLGNIIKKVAGAGGFFDCAYALRFKLKDFIANERSLFTDPFVVNTNQIAHKIRLGYSYHFSDSFGFSLQGSGIFAGKNSLQNLQGMLLFNFNF